MTALARFDKITKVGRCQGHILPATDATGRVYLNRGWVDTPWGIVAVHASRTGCVLSVIHQGVRYERRWKQASGIPANRTLVTAARKFVGDLTTGVRLRP
jgi:hypothetical protein